MRFPDVESWLGWQETLYHREIDLTLDRLFPVYERMSRLPPDTRVISIAGTNGKGSCVAVMESVLRASGHSVAAYTSPHLFRYNERIRVDGVPVSDESLMAAFQIVDEARRDTALTYFEYGTLSALEIFARSRPEFVLLEVGLGGRLDAVNIIDSDVAVITTIGLDHQSWLGDDRDAIAGEKAGIMRSGRPVVIGERKPPERLIAEARKRRARPVFLGKDFELSSSRDHWDFHGSVIQMAGLPRLKGPLLDNAACALEALCQLGSPALLKRDNCVRALGSVSVPARMQHVERGGCDWIVDLAHNQPAAEAVAKALSQNPVDGRTLAILGLLREKDAPAIVAAMSGVVDEWILVDVHGSRGRSAAALRDAAFQGAEGAVILADDVISACGLAEKRTNRGDRVIAMGSFHVAGPALEFLGLTTG
jgi:dihydrofolate synthase/folylpolyglutamate synthase